MTADDPDRGPVSGEPTPPAPDPGADPALDAGVAAAREVGTEVDAGVDSDAPPQMNPPVRRGRGGAPRPGQDPVGFLRESVRMGWRWLVRMRTALYLLALLGLLTLVATVVPQEPNVGGTVQDWRTGEEGPGETVAALIDLVGGFDVYGSPAFLALLLLLFLSLTACLVPRITAWVRLVRKSQPPRSRHLHDQPQVAHLETDLPPEQVHAAARDVLGHRRRWRLRSPARPGAPGIDQVAAERGLWSREGGSLVFHLSFYVLVLAIVYGQLASFEGQVGVTEGEMGFADTQVSYWTYRPGRWWGEDDHAGWLLDLDEFHVDWVRDPGAPGAGQPTTFASDVTIEHADGEVTTTRVEGNSPATIEGMKIHQLDWGYAPQVRLEDADGEVVYDDFLTATINDDGAFPHFRAAVKAPAAEPDLGLDVFFFPFAPPDEQGQPQPTGAPWDEAPLMIVQEYRGDLQLGRTQQTINELDTTAMDSTGGAALRPGEQVELSDGTVLTFPELRRWVGFQVSRRPQIPMLLVASGLLFGGLVPALYAYRRRVWVEAVRDETRERTLVTVAGRAFQRPQTFESEHADLVRRIAARIGAEPVEPGPGPARIDDPAPSGADPRMVSR